MSDELEQRHEREREELERQHAIEQAELDDQEVGAGERPSFAALFSQGDVALASLRQRVMKAEARVEELERDGSPGVMHEVDKAFHDLAVAQRDGAWREVENEKQKLLLSERHADELRAARDGFLGELTELRVYAAKLKDLVRELSEVPLNADVKRFDALVGRARVLILLEGDDA